MQDSFSNNSSDNPVNSFNSPQFLKDLLGIKPIGAYPVGQWAEYINCFLTEIDLHDYNILVEIYDERGGMPLSRNRKRELRRVLEKLSALPVFEELESAVEDYEQNQFCNFDASDFCDKCGMKRNRWKAFSPLCSGIPVETAPAVRLSEHLSDEDFMLSALDVLGLAYEPGRIGDFDYDSAIHDVPVVVWKFCDTPLTKRILTSILKRAETSGVNQLYLVLKSNLGVDLPLAVPNHISYNILTIPDSQFLST